MATNLREYRSFQEARSFVRSIGLKNSDEWRSYSQSGKRPDDIPASPNQVYKNLGWSGMGDWIGTGSVASFNRQYRPFKDAREFVRGLKLNNQKEWRAFAKSSKRPPNIPSNPWDTYKDKGWAGIGDWIGTGSVASFNRQYRPFKDAREFVRSLGLKSSAEWFAYCKSGNKPIDIPAAANSTYRAAL